MCAPKVYDPGVSDAVWLSGVDMGDGSAESLERAFACLWASVEQSLGCLENAGIDVSMGILAAVELAVSRLPDPPGVPQEENVGESRVPLGVPPFPVAGCPVSFRLGSS